MYKDLFDTVYRLKLLRIKISEDFKDFCLASKIFISILQARILLTLMKPQNFIMNFFKGNIIQPQIFNL